MGLNKHYDELKQILDEQICKILKKGDITPQELDSLYKASAIMLDMETEKAMKESEEGGYSQRMSYMNGQSNHYPWFMYQDRGMSNRGNSYSMNMNTYDNAYDGAYDGAYDASQENNYSGRRGRSSRTGRYVSRDSGYSRDKERMIEKLEEMMDEVATDKERRALQQCVDKLEQQ